MIQYFCSFCHYPREVFVLSRYTCIVRNERDISMGSRYTSQGRARFCSVNILSRPSYSYSLFISAVDIIRQFDREASEFFFSSDSQFQRQFFLIKTMAAARFVNPTLFLASFLLFPAMFKDFFLFLLICFSLLLQLKTLSILFFYLYFHLLPLRKLNFEYHRPKQK